MRCTVALATLIAIAGMAGRVPAQPVVPAAAPGQIERQFQPPPQPRSVPQVLQIPGTDQSAPAGAEAMRFTTRRIVLDGATALPAALSAAAVAPYEGREISVADLYELARRLAATYRNEGFVLAQVLVPEQRIEPQDALVRLQVIEGFIHAVRFSGDLADDTARLEAIAQAIRSTHPITAAALERYLLLLNDIPGLSAATTLAPSSAQAGAADLEIRLSRRAVAGEIVIDNRGSRAVGPWRATLDLEARGLTGTSRTAAKLATSGNGQLEFGQLQHEQVINAEGTRLALSIGGARSQPGTPSPPATLQLETASRTLGLSIQHPLVRSRAQNLYLRLGLHAYDGRTLANAMRTGEDRIRSVRLGLTWDRADTWQGLNIVDLEFAKGLSHFGASDFANPEKSRAAGRPDFAKASAYAARLQSLGPRWSLLVAASAQYAWNDLLAPELFSIGGDTFGRGYEPSELLGDSGAALKLELRYTDRIDEPWLSASYTLYAFYDAGIVRRRTPVNEAAHASLASAGLGVRFGSERRVSGFVEIAQPLTRTVALRGDRDARSYAGLAARF